ncbi:putative dehydrogenase, partial [Globisporangium splendens]
MTVDAYGKTVGGKLKLKGGLSLKPKKKEKKHKKKRVHDADATSQSSASAAANFELVKVKGTGRILSSGATLMGQVGTKFLLELSVGDAIIIQHPTSLVEETRIVRMVLSDISAAISSPFSSDLVSSTSFHYIKAPPEEHSAEQEEKKKKIKHAADEANAFGTYAGGTEVGSQYAYRVKKSGAYGGYAIIKEDANVNRSREDLLDLRSKKKGDRHCM